MNKKILVAAIAASLASHRDGVTALEHARERGHTEMVAMLERG